MCNVQSIIPWMYFLFDTSSLMLKPPPRLVSNGRLQQVGRNLSVKDAWQLFSAKMVWIWPQALINVWRLQKLLLTTEKAKLVAQCEFNDLDTKPKRKDFDLTSAGSYPQRSGDGFSLPAVPSTWLTPWKWSQSGPLAGLSYWPWHQQTCAEWDRNVGKMGKPITRTGSYKSQRFAKTKAIFRWNKKLWSSEKHDQQCLK